MIARKDESISLEEKEVLGKRVGDCSQMLDDSLFIYQSLTGIKYPKEVEVKCE